MFRREFREVNKNLGKIKNVFLLSAIIFLGANCSFAADVNLSEINISQAKNGYSITLKTDKQVDFKKSFKTDKNLLINLKNTSANDYTTSYNNVSDINNVTVITEKENLKIEIQGENIKNSRISVVPSESAQSALPVAEYEIQAGETFNWADLSPARLFKNQDKTAPSGGFNWMTIIGFGLIVMTAGKLFAKKEAEAKENYEREKEIAKKLNAEMCETMLLRNKITRNSSAPSINYEAKKRHLHELTAIKVRAERTRNSQNTTATRATTTSPIRNSMNVKAEIDSMKFLESMTRIYENSGRNDLADNLKKNINKVNI